MVPIPGAKGANIHKKTPPFTPKNATFQTQKLLYIIKGDLFRGERYH